MRRRLSKRALSPAVLGVLTVLVCGPACRTVYSENGELTREQCADLVRHVQVLESADTSGLLAARATLRSGIEGCLMNGTERAHRCVMEAQSAQDLESCKALFK